MGRRRGYGGGETEGKTQNEELKVKRWRGEGGMKDTWRGREADDGRWKRNEMEKLRSEEINER